MQWSLQAKQGPEAQVGGGMGGGEAQSSPKGQVSGGQGRCPRQPGSPCAVRMCSLLPFGAHQPWAGLSAAHEKAKKMGKSGLGHGKAKAVGPGGSWLCSWHTGGAAGHAGHFQDYSPEGSSTHKRWLPEVTAGPGTAGMCHLCRPPVVASSGPDCSGQCQSFRWASFYMSFNC